MTPLQLVARISRLMDEVNVPKEGRGLTLPAKYGKFLLAELSDIHRSEILEAKELKVLGMKIDINNG